MEFEVFDQLPKEAKPSVLFSELQELKGQISSLPDETARKVAQNITGQFVSVKDCVHVKGGSPPPPQESWLSAKSILSGLIGLGIVVGTAYNYLNPTDPKDKPTLTVSVPKPQGTNP